MDDVNIVPGPKTLAIPMQDRSRRALDRILSGLEHLLRTRSFDRITVAEIAAQAGISAGSIYVRFADKQALLIALHQRVHERGAPLRQRLVHPDRWRGAGLDPILRTLIRAALRYYRQHGAILRAAALNAPPDVALRVGQDIRNFNAALTSLAAPRLADIDRNRLAVAIDATVRTIIAVLIVRSLQQDTSAVPLVPEAQLARELNTIARALLDGAEARR